MSVVRDLLKPDLFGADGPAMDEDVPCSLCGRVLEVRRMMKLQITRPEGEALTRYLCPPHASSFSRAWIEIGMEAVR